MGYSPLNKSYKTTTQDRHSYQAAPNIVKNLETQDRASECSFMPWGHTIYATFVYLLTKFSSGWQTTDLTMLSRERALATVR